MACHITMIAMQFKFVTLSQLRYESFVGLRFAPPQAMIKVNYREHHPNFPTQLQQQTQECD